MCGSPLLQCVMDRVTGGPTDQLSPLARRWMESLGSYSTTVSGVIAGRDKTVFTAITDSLHRANTLASTNAHKVYLYSLLRNGKRTPSKLQSKGK